MGKHRDLVLRASRWLRGTMSCGVVLCECAGDGLEQPDVIGWKLGGRHSILVEVKTSRADFFRDQRKWHRRAGRHLGQERWYFTESGLVEPSEVPEGWGLAELSETDRVNKRVKPPKLERYDFEITRREHGLLFSAMRKVTLGIAPDTYGNWSDLSNHQEEESHAYYQEEGRQEEGQEGEEEEGEEGQKEVHQEAGEGKEDPRPCDRLG